MESERLFRQAKIPVSEIHLDNKGPVVIAIIPTYKKQNNFTRITEEASKHVTSIIVVDDGSADRTEKVINSADTIVVRNRPNMGKGAALRVGFSEALKHDPDLVVTLDADGQHDPADIPKLLLPIKSGEADIVIGSRFKIDTISGLSSLAEVHGVRKFGLSIINILNKSLVKDVKDSQSGFRSYSKNVLCTVVHYSTSGFGAEVELLAAAELYGFHITEVSIKYRELKNTSKKNSIIQGADIVSTILRIAVERKPLLFFGLTGIILIASAIIPSSDMLNF